MYGARDEKKRTSCWEIRFKKKKSAPSAATVFGRVWSFIRMREEKYPESLTLCSGDINLEREREREFWGKPKYKSVYLSHNLQA